MKDSLKQLKFWQKKRNELQINDDPQADWLSMQSLLETHLPVNNHPTIKKGSSFKGKIFKMLPKLLVTFSAAAMVYTASHFILKKVQHHHTRHRKPNNERLLADSTYRDSLIADSIALLKDSLIPTNQSMANDSNVSDAVNSKKEFTSSPSNNHPNGIATNSKTNSSASLSAAKSLVQNKSFSGVTSKTDNKLTSASTPNNKTVSGNNLGSSPSTGNKTGTGNKLKVIPAIGDKTITGNRLNSASSINIKTVPGNKLGSSPSFGNKTNTVNKLGANSAANINTVNGYKLRVASASSNKANFRNKPGNRLLTTPNNIAYKNKLPGGVRSGNENKLDHRRNVNSSKGNKTKSGSTLSKNNGVAFSKNFLSTSKSNKRGNTNKGDFPSGSSKIDPTVESHSAKKLDNDENPTTTGYLLHKNQEMLTAAPPQTLSDAVNSNSVTNSKRPDQKPYSKLLADQSKNSSIENKSYKPLRNAKTASQKNSGTSKLNWGVLGGVNTSGSFTPSKQNANFYGSSPVDAYLGLFATYSLNDQWSVGLQTQFYSPQSISTSYTHANTSKVDSGQSLQITASRKLYTVNIPINVIYKVSDSFSLMGGPVIGIPVKQINTSSTLLPVTIKNDSAYYAKVSGIINQTNYEQKLNIGLNAGVGFQYKRWLFQASYLKSLTGYAISNSWGTYKSSGGTFQFTVGFQISKPKQ
jgi:hypothetical protein